MKILLTSVFTGLWEHGGGPVNVMRGMLNYCQQNPPKNEFRGLFSFKTKNNQNTKNGGNSTSGLFKSLILLVTFARNKFKKTESLIIILLVIKYYFHLKKELEINKYDIIHFHDVVSAYIYLKYFYHKYKHPNVLTIQSVGPFYLEFPKFSGGEDFVSRQLQQWERFALLHCRTIVFPSKGAQIKYIEFSANDQQITNKLNSNKVKIIHNGIDMKSIDSLIERLTQNKLRQQFHINKNEKIIITIARYIHSKGVDQIPILAKKFQSIGYRFFIVGFGELKNKLENTITKLKLKNLHLISPLTRKEIINLIKISDIFFMPSRYTVFDIVMLEALYLRGAILLASRIPGHSEMIKNNYNGFLSTPHNYYKNIYEIMKLKTSEKLAIKKNGFNTVINKFSIQIMINNYQKLYPKIIN